jgi:hypothetical protein
VVEEHDEEQVEEDMDVAEAEEEDKMQVEEDMDLAKDKE